MRVLVIGTNVPSAADPTHGIFAFGQAKALHRAGHEVVYAAVDMRSIRRRRRMGVIRSESEGMPIYSLSLPLGGIPLRMRSHVFSMSLRFLYKHAIQPEFEPEIVHSHFLLAGFGASVLAKSERLPFVHTEHSSLVMQTPLNGQVEAIAKLIYDRADRVVAVSPVLRDVVRRSFGVESTVIPNILDSSLFQNKRVEHTGFSIVSVGNLINLKRMDLTIEAFARSVAHEPHSSLTIIGDGPERRTLECLAEKLGIASQVRFTGIREHTFVADQFSKADLFVLASQKETFGVAYIEALASGLPVVATRCGGPEHFLHASNSILVDVDDLHGLTDALERAHMAISVFDPGAISDSAHSEFGEEAVVEQVTSLLRQVIASEGTSM